MNTTKDTQHFLFYCIDKMNPELLADVDSVSVALEEAARERVGTVYPELAQYIRMLVAEYCPLKDF